MGFPGSGKTTVIALIIDILIKLKKRVLVTALTNNALDNILVKLKQKGINFARISNNEKVVDPQIRKNILKKDSFSTMSSAKEMLETTYVYGATVSGINHVVFGYLNLDYCIIDEACQILEPLILGALMLCEKFILVGDPYQVSLSYN
jgi:DNA replication ATP-dependent helicase Dna2